MKRTYAVLIGLGILVLGVLVVVAFMGRGAEKNVATKMREEKPLVSTTLVAPQSMPYVVSATGTLSAVQNIELYSEVQGVLLQSRPLFKEGNSFGKGQTILQIDNAEYLAQLQSSKSSLVSQIAAMLADMEIEFPEAAKKWERYLKNFDINRKLEPLPQFSSDAEKFFVTGRGITQTYFNVKNQQERLSKYYITAPFDGVVTEANVDPGTLVRNGQKLGEFIDNSVYELKLSIPATENRYLTIGKPVRLGPLKGNATYKGAISRINPKINQQTQTIEVFVKVRNPNLKDGQYLKAEIYGEKIDGVVQIESSLLVENDHVYIVVDSTLQLQKVAPLNYVGDHVIVSGLKTGTILVIETIGNAYPGLKVTY
ncbi:efflux RND transporter periplasmic adaptor subunit [Allomuricauda sp. SCSIO 65647]|uniref:efflux RND transporter periplasmic adaptor subunit n=1 Tax=Allomuricauda sp. SCSIO 65647 TaxID=2908843 RepID=UPI001F2B0233|nr:HlyD family efflux transporter periplasmic adaptor subunit [Muricauda sp. SCSIO 65647]UJH69139.1 HlyD family efflux transporter periplasmic adaptor subunit [Muricauda sp. SCSIO 65647]